MIIGIDIDGVLTEIHTFFMDCGAKYAYEEGLAGIVDKDQYEIEDVLNSKGINSDFWHKNGEIYRQKKYTRQFAPEIIRKLKEQGNGIHIITARQEWEREGTTKWLEENGISYDVLVMTEEKLEYCMENNVDIMVEDNVKNMEKISTEIPVICIDNPWNKGFKGPNITRCYGWYDVYKTINKEMK